MLYDDDYDPQLDLFGTEPYKLYRPEGPITSKEAAEAVDTSRLEKLVLDIIASFGWRGCISDEVRRRTDELGYRLSYSSVTARYKALAEKGLIVYTGQTRQGISRKNQRVMRAAWITAPQGN